MRRAIFHIGTPKTGTTTIQNALAANRESLAGLGVLYPLSGLRVGSHGNLAYQFDPVNFAPEYGGWDELEKEVLEVDPHTVIVSSESILTFSRSGALFGRIDQFCKVTRSRPEIVVYVRPQYEYLDSLYAQNATTGYEKRKFESYVSRSALGKGFDYNVLLGQWEQRFDDLRVRVFSSTAGAELLATFLEGAGIPQGALPIPTPMRENARATVRAVEYGRKSGELLTGLVTPSEGREIVRLLAKLCRDDFPSDPKFSGMTPELATLVEGQFRDRNLAFLARHSRAGNELSFPPAASQPFTRQMMDLDLASQEERDRFVSMHSRALLEWAATRAAPATPSAVVAAR